MKLALIVAEGVHKGKAIPITTPEFLIGRDPHCQLRPASQAISKQHCAVLIRDGKVIVKDFGSTNGTYVNEVRVEGECEIKDTDALKVGPLAFTVKLEKSPAKAPAKVAAGKPGSNPNIVQPAPKPATVAETEATDALDSDVDIGGKMADSESDGPRSDKIAALLLGMGGDDESPEGEPAIPDGSTVMDMPAIDPATGEKKPEAPKPSEKQANSNMAADILKKYMRRPRT